MVEKSCAWGVQMTEVGGALPERQSLFAKAWKKWEKIGSVLAILGLADLFGQTIKWAAGIHWIVSKYSIAKAWLFSFAPFHIPPEMHEPIVISLILFSVTSIGFYREIGRTYTGQIFRLIGYAAAK